MHAAAGLFFHIFKGLSVFSGRNPHIFIEHGIQVAGTAEAEGIGNVADGNICIHQQTLRLSNAPLHGILDRGNAEFIFKGMGKIVGIDMQIPADLLQCQGFPVMLVQIAADTVRCCGSRGARPDDRIAFPALQQLIGKQQEGDGKCSAGLSKRFRIIG